jgi:hypothetical protein
MPKKGSSHSVSLLKFKSIFFIDEDDVEPVHSVDEGLSEQGALNDGLDDQRV